MAKNENGIKIRVAAPGNFKEENKEPTGRSTSKTLRMNGKEYFTPVEVFIRAGSLSAILSDKYLSSKEENFIPSFFLNFNDAINKINGDGMNYTFNIINSLKEYFGKEEQEETGTNEEVALPSRIKEKVVSAKRDFRTFLTQLLDQEHVTLEDLTTSEDETLEIKTDLYQVSSFFFMNTERYDTFEQNLKTIATEYKAGDLGYPAARSPTPIIFTPDEAISRNMMKMFVYILEKSGEGISEREEEIFKAFIEYNTISEKPVDAKAYLKELHRELIVDRDLIDHMGTNRMLRKEKSDVYEALKKDFTGEERLDKKELEEKTRQFHKIDAERYDAIGVSDEDVLNRYLRTKRDLGGKNLQRIKEEFSKLDEQEIYASRMYTIDSNTMLPVLNSTPVTPLTTIALLYLGSPSDALLNITRET